MAPIIITENQKPQLFEKIENSLESAHVQMNFDVQNTVIYWNSGFIIISNEIHCVICIFDDCLCYIRRSSFGAS